MTREQAFERIKALVPSLRKAQRDFATSQLRIGPKWGASEATGSVWPVLADILTEPGDCRAYILAAQEAAGTEAVDAILEQITD